MINNKRDGILCKFDMEKAFEHVCWDFLNYVLNRMGFGRKWRRWIRWCISSASFAVIVNEGLSSSFTASRGLRQGDQLSTLLFITAMKALRRLLEQAKEMNLLNDINIGGESSQTELSHIFFVDDTLIFCQPETSMLLNLRCVLLRFQAVSDLKINLHKFELVRIGDGSDGKALARVLGCTSSQLPINYLSLPLGAKYKDGGTWKPIIKLF